MAGASKGAHFGLRDVSSLLLRDVEKVEDAVVAHHRESAVPLVKGNRLELLLDLDLGEAQVAIEVLAHHFEERESGPTSNTDTRQTAHSTPQLGPRPAYLP